MLFNRTYRLLIGKKGDPRGVEIHDTLRITFDIEKTTKKNPNKGKISIWNLTKETRAKFEEPNTRVLLYAGYKDEKGPLLIYTGDVTFAYTQIEKPDISTVFELGDGSRSIRDSVISKGYGPGVTSETILKDCSESMGTPLTLPGDAPKKVWEHGFTFYGASHILMDKVTSASGLEWSIQNNNMQVIEKNGVTTRQGVVISSHSGMIGAPERVRKAKVQKAGEKTEVVAKNESEDGWKVNVLLMPELNPGDRVILQSDVVEGVFRIFELKHRGDSHGGDWQTELQLVDPNKPLTSEGSKKGGKKSAKSTVELPVL
jgi:hypothetical protein